MKPGLKFQPGSALAYGDPTYIKRRFQFFSSMEDYSLRAMDQDGRDIVICGPRQVGKSSLLAWLSAVLKNDRGYATATVDMMGLSDSNLDETQWLDRFWNILIQQLGDNVERDMNVPAPTLIVDLSDHLRRLTRFVRSNRISIFIDEADVLPSHILAPFYKQIRTIVNQRMISGDAALAKYRFAYAGVFEPESLLEKQATSPFNVALTIWVDDFTFEETCSLVTLLAQKHGIVFHEEIAPNVYAWTDGHPFLVQCVASIIDDALESGRNPEDIEPEFVDQVIAFIVNHNGKNLLNPIRNEVVGWATNKHRRKLLADLIKGEERLGPGTHLSKLRLLGAVKQKNGHWQIRNRLVWQMLAHEFEEDWPPDPSRINRELHALMIQFFNVEDVRTLCFNLDVSYDAIPGEALDGKVRELILYLQRKNQLPELMESLKLERPLVNWPSL